MYFRTNSKEYIPHPRKGEAFRRGLRGKDKRERVRERQREREQDMES